MVGNQRGPLSHPLSVAIHVRLHVCHVRILLQQRFDKVAAMAAAMQVIMVVVAARQLAQACTCAACTTATAKRGCSCVSVDKCSSTATAQQHCMFSIAIACSA